MIRSSLRSTLIALSLSGALLAQQTSTGVSQPIRWQAPGEASGTAQPPKQAPAAKKSRGRTKWIVLGAVAAGAVIGLVMVNKRLDNEGHGIF